MDSIFEINGLQALGKGRVVPVLHWARERVHILRLVLENDRAVRLFEGKVAIYSWGICRRECLEGSGGSASALIRVAMRVMCDSCCVFSQGVGPYTKSIKTVEEDIQKDFQRVNELAGVTFGS